MAFEILKAEIGLILETFSNPPHDRFELYIRLKERAQRDARVRHDTAGKYFGVRSSAGPGVRHQTAGAV